MSVEYMIRFSANLGKAFPQVGELCDNLNTVLSTYGVDEKLSIFGDVLTGVLKSERELTTEEIDKVKSLFRQQIEAEHPAWSFKVDVVRRKSGNVQQSVSQ